MVSQVCIPTLERGNESHSSSPEVGLQETSGKIVHGLALRKQRFVTKEICDTHSREGASCTSQPQSTSQ